jgi:hypothetical protein
MTDSDRNCRLEITQEGCDLLESGELCAEMQLMLRVALACPGITDEELQNTLRDLESEFGVEGALDLIRKGRIEFGRLQ